MKQFLLPALTVLLLIGLCQTTQAVDGVGGLDLFFVQNGDALKAEKTKTNHLRVELVREAFEIHYSTQELVVCASTENDVFDKAPVGTDVMADFSSCMFIIKAFAMDLAGGALIVEEGGANWLNPSHGAKALKSSGNVFRITRFTGKDMGDLAISDIRKPIYLVLWDDRDKNKKIDSGETARVELQFQ